MRTLALLACIGLCIFATGCATSAPISANPVQDIQTPLQQVKTDLGLKPGHFDIATGLQEAAYNFDGAIKVGIVDQRIVAASACVHGVMKQLGLEEGQQPAPSFTPKTDTVLGVGSVLFIRAVQAGGATGQGIQVPPGCQQQLGQILLDVAAQGKNALPGGGLLPPLRP